MQIKSWTPPECKEPLIGEIVPMDRWIVVHDDLQKHGQKKDRSLVWSTSSSGVPFFAKYWDTSGSASVDTTAEDLNDENDYGDVEEEHTELQLKTPNRNVNHNRGTQVYPVWDLAILAFLYWSIPPLAVPC
ncbi:hypothetical protein ACA910_001523 [Epithemia clementina (nom. ined.)]